MTTGSLPVASLAIIGGGRMGEAILAGLLDAGALEPDAIVVAEPDGARRGSLSQRYGITCVETAAEAAVRADVVLLAVKPQVIDSVVAAMPVDVAGRLVISIAAGISCARLEAALPSGTPVVRVMPNTPALVGAGMALISGGGDASAAHVDTVRRLFDTIGETVVVDERYQDAGTAISGSGPAYFALFVDALARAGVAQGLSREVAQKLAVSTMSGTARLITETGTHPEQVVDGVASPGGTTIAAIERLEAGGVRAAISDAVAAAVRRARELGS